MNERNNKKNQNVFTCVEVPVGIGKGTTWEIDIVK